MSELEIYQFEQMQKALETLQEQYSQLDNAYHVIAWLVFAIFFGFVGYVILDIIEDSKKKKDEKKGGK